MPQGIVISLEILVIRMGYRGSKSDSFLFVKEQRVDGAEYRYFLYLRCILRRLERGIIIKVLIFNLNK